MNTNLAYDDWQEKMRVELLDGTPVMMSPPSTNHILISGNIYGIFQQYLKGKKCTPLPDGMMLYLTEADHFIPDFMVVCDRSKIKWNGVHGAPDLVAEILSPSTGKNDKGRKKKAYESIGVPEYWIVDPLNRSVEVYLLENGHYELNDFYTLYPAEQLAEMTAEEKTALVTEFTCHLYDDLMIRLDDIFYDLL